MQTYVAFLRAVNVRPRWVKMQTLREVLLAAGFANVETYIQSGNVRVSSPMPSVEMVRSELERVIEAEFGFVVPCIVRTPAELRAVAAYADGLASPFPGEEPRRYVSFCSEPAGADAATTLDAWDASGERVRVHGAEIHWWLTKPSHRAKLSNARIEKLIGPATTRDLKVVRSLADRWGC